MTISPPAVLNGCQTPRVSSWPDYTTTVGDDAIEVASLAGLNLDPWQQLVLRHGLGQQPSGRWAAFEAALIVARQNGKGGVIEALELAWLFLLGERLVIHTAHEFKTAQEAFLRILQLVQSNPEFDSKVKRVRTSHGEEGIELKTGQRLRFMARSGGAGRGFTGDKIIYDEAMFLPTKVLGASMPTLRARPNPQIWYFGSAGFDESEHLRRLRDRGTRGGDPSLAFFEWSAHPDRSLDDTEGWAEANPALGIRIDVESMFRERATLDEREFARELLGIWDDGRHDYIIDPATWGQWADKHSQARDPVAFAIDTTPDRRRSAIGLAGIRSDSRHHLEVVEHRDGTGWVVERVLELVRKWEPCAVAIDPTSPAASLTKELRSAGVEVTESSARDMAKACGGFYDDAIEGRLRHMDDPRLTSALSGASKRPIGDAWGWNRKSASSDISPLVAVTLARWALIEADYGKTVKRSNKASFL